MKNDGPRIRATSELLDEAITLVSDSSRPIVARIIGSAATWQYCQIHSRENWLLQFERFPRDIDLVFAHRGAAALVARLEENRYAVDRSLLVESGGTRIRATGERFSVDGFADPLTFRQTLLLGRRLVLCPHTITLTDLLLTKFQIDPISDADTIDAVALMLCSADPKDECSVLDTKRLCSVVASSWRWMNAIEIALDAIGVKEAILGRLREDDRDAVRTTVERIRVIIAEAPRTPLWRLGRAFRRVLPDANVVDE